MCRNFKERRSYPSDVTHQEIRWPLIQKRPRRKERKATKRRMEHENPKGSSPSVKWPIFVRILVIPLVFSIQEGKVVPSMLLRKLTNYSRKNRLYQAFRELGCVIRTIFLLQYISDVKLREIIHATTNKVEQYHSFSKWIHFGGEGKIAEHTPEEMEKHIKYKDLLANCLVLHNTVEISNVLNGMAKEGFVLTKEDLAALSPYQTQHIKRFGNYDVDLNRLPQPMTDDLTFELNL